MIQRCESERVLTVSQ